MKMSKSNPIRSNSSQFTVPPPSLNKSNRPIFKSYLNNPIRKPDHLPNQPQLPFFGEKQLLGKTSARRHVLAPSGGPSRFASFTRKLGRLPWDEWTKRGIWRAFNKKESLSPLVTPKWYNKLPRYGQICFNKNINQQEKPKQQGCFFFGGEGIDCMYKLYGTY